MNGKGMSAVERAGKAKCLFVGENKAVAREDSRGVEDWMPQLGLWAYLH